MKRPLAVTIVGWLFIVAGTVGFIYHLPELDLSDPFGKDAILISFVRLLAIAGGILTLRGSKNGFWLLIAWMTYHMYISIFHTTAEVITHAVFLVVLVYIFFHPKVADFFRSRANTE
jgi:hypothetical protein